MPDNENLEQNEQNETAAAADSGVDVEEIKSMIKALTTQVDALKDELKRKEPEPRKPADFDAYFAQYMTGKKKQ